MQIFLFSAGDKSVHGIEVMNILSLDRERPLTNIALTTVVCSIESGTSWVAAFALYQ